MKYLIKIAQMIGAIVAIVSPISILLRWIYQSCYCDYYNLPVQLIYDSLDVIHFLPIIMYGLLLVSFLYLRYRIIQADLMMKVMTRLKIYKQNGKRPLCMEVILFVGEIAFFYQSYMFIVRDRVETSIHAYIIKIVITLLPWSFCSDPITLKIIEHVRRFFFEKVGKLYSFRYTFIILGGFILYVLIVLLSYKTIQQQKSFLMATNITAEDDKEQDASERFYIILFETETLYMVEEARLYLPGQIGNSKLLYIFTDHCKYIEKNNVEIEELDCDTVITRNSKVF